MGGELIWFICHFWLSCKEIFFSSSLLHIEVPGGQRIRAHTAQCLDTSWACSLLTIMRQEKYWRFWSVPTVICSRLQHCTYTLLLLLLPYRIYVLYSPLFVLGYKLAFSSRCNAIVKSDFYAVLDFTCSGLQRPVPAFDILLLSYSICFP